MKVEMTLANRGLLALAALVAAAAGQFVEDSIEVPVHTGIQNLTYNPDADVVYGTTGERDSVIFVIDCATKQIVAIDTVPFPFNFLYDYLDHKAYCPFPGNLETDSLLILDGWNHARIRAVYVGSIVPGWAVWAHDNDRLYMPLFEQDSIQVLDCRTDSVLCRIKVGREPDWLWVNLRHQKLYVADNYDSTITVIDRRTNQVIRTFPSGADDWWIDLGLFSETSDRLLYGPAADDLVALDGNADSIVWVTDLPGSGRAIVEIPELGRVLVACNVRSTVVDSVFAVDIATGAIVNRIGVGNLGHSPRALGRSPVTGLIFCTNSGSDVSVIASDGSRVVATLPVPTAGFVFSPVQRRVFLWNSNMVYVVRDTTTGIAETAQPRWVNRRLAGWVVRGVFVWPEAESGLVIDASGRKVAEVRPGPNDLSRLSTGVYAVVGANGRVATRFVKLN